MIPYSTTHTYPNDRDRDRPRPLRPIAFGKG